MKNKLIESITVIGITLLLALILGLSMIDYDTMNEAKAVANTIERQSNQQYLANTTCYTATGSPMYNGIYPEWQDVAIRFNSPLVAEMGLKVGDRIWIEEFAQEFRVGDRIPDYQKADLDIYFEQDVAGCKQWGRKNLIIEKI